MNHYHIRWLIRRDMREVLHIQQGSFEFSWTEEDFLKALRQRNCIGMVCEFKEKIVGFMIYSLHKHKLHILNFAVDPDHLREDIGTTMFKKLESKLSVNRRTMIALEVRETNLAAQLFFREMGFRATDTYRGYYEGTSESAYHMEFRVEFADYRDDLPEFHPTNRIFGNQEA